MAIAKVKRHTTIKATKHAQVLHQYAGELVRCTHPSRDPLVEGLSMAWCPRCGSIFWDGHWQRPHLHESIGDALKK
jgi:hypothetical protein